MNGNLQSAVDLVDGIKAGDAGNASLAICPPAVYLMKIGGMLADSEIALGVSRIPSSPGGRTTSIATSPVSLPDLGSFRYQESNRHEKSMAEIYQRCRAWKPGT